MERVFGFMVVLWLAGCGGSRPPSATTVTGGHVEVAVGSSAVEAVSSVVVPTDAAPADPEPTEDIDVDEVSAIVVEETEPRDADEVSAIVADETEPRDVDMMSYEEAMALPVELGDATSAGGEAQLRAETIARIMDGHLDEMYEACIRKEIERGHAFGEVTMDLAIRGRDGLVLGVTVEPGRRRFKRCLAGYLEDVRFPAFASPRMGARYHFHIG